MRPTSIRAAAASTWNCLRAPVDPPSSRRASDERSGARSVPGYEAEPKDLGIDVPEFIPN